MKTLAEEYKGVLLRESVGSEECQRVQKQFNKQVEQFRQRLAEYRVLFLRNLFLKDEEAPEIQKIFDQHDTRKAALADIFRCREDQISTTKEEALSGDIVLHDGHLNLNFLKKLPEEVRLPEYIKGGLGLGNLTTLPEEVQLPKYVGSSLILHSLTELPEEVQLPEYVGKSLHLNNLAELPEGVQLPEYIGGSLALHSLAELPDDFTFPEHIGSILFLNKKLKGHSALSTIPKGVSIKWR